MKKTFDEEELENIGSESDTDRVEERPDLKLEQPDHRKLFHTKQDTNSSKKGGQGKKGKNAGQKPSAGQDDVVAALEKDWDLPEIVTMTEGRRNAQKLKKEERESGRRIAAEAKRRRQERAANSIRNKQEDEKIPQMLDAEHIQELNPEEQGQGQQQLNAGGMLDDTIVQFISEREKAGLDERESSPALTKGEPKKRQKSRKKVVQDRVQLILLDRKSTPVDQTALEFKYNHLFGNRLKRDLSMLQNLSKLSG